MTARRPGGIRRLFRLGLVRAQVRRDLDDELAFHFEEAVRELVSQGLTEEEARRKALDDFGDEEAYRKALQGIGERRARKLRRSRWLDALRWNVRSTVRSAVRRPALTMGIIATLGLGLGANATFFGLVDRVLLRPPDHIVDADRVRRVLLERPGGPNGELIAANSWSYPDYSDLEAHTRGSVAGYTDWTERTIGEGVSARRVRVSLATRELFSLLGVTPASGRFFRAEEATPGAPLTAVIGAELWERAYGADAGVVGSTIQVSGIAVEVVGIAPAGFTGVDLERIDVWVPLEATQSADGRGCMASRRCYFMKTVARVDDGTELGTWESEATRLLENAYLDEAGASTDRVRVLLEPVLAARGTAASPEARLLLWLLGVAGIILIIACANVGTLLAARSVGRRPDLAVRMALGAGRRRIVGQVAFESILLALAGAGLGLVLARWGAVVIRSTLLPEIHFPGSATSWRMFGFTLLVALLAGALATVAPALQAARVDVWSAMSKGASGQPWRRSRVTVIVTNLQAALSIVLLVAAGLFVRSVAELRSVDIGLDVDALLQARLEFRASRLPDREWNELYEEAATRVASLPGVLSAAATSAPIGFASEGPIEVPGLDSIPTLPGGGPYARTVSADYFETAGVAILRGRGIEEGEVARIVVVSETMARTLWPDSDALGKCILLYGEEECTRVVGVAEDAARIGFRDAPFMAYYEPVPADHGSLYQALYVRAEEDADLVIGDVSLLLRSFSPEVRNADVQTVAGMLDSQTRQWRVGAVLFSLFGFLAMSLAAIGLYAVLAFDVARHRREIGIRASLGAGKGRLMRDVLLRGARLTIFGIGAGMAFWYLIAPHMQQLLFEVSPRDPSVLGGVVVLLGLVATAGSLLPGLRATRVDPVIALRCE